MKNKVLSILAIFITFITLSCKTDLIEKETIPNDKGLISIRIGNNAKMLSPNTENIDINSITSWTVTFTNKDDTTKQLQRTTSNGTLKEYLPFGIYIIEIEGTTQSGADGSSTLTFYGKTEASISPEEKSTTANIYVAPKKSESGTGSFEYIITLNETSYSLAENSFTAKLSSVYNNSDPIQIEAEVENNAENKTCTVIFNKDLIPSGYYTLTISCTPIPNDNNPTPITQILQKDILVEICDNAKTSDSIELQVADYKTLYAVTPTSDDGDKYANYSGGFKQYPADFLNILNDDTITGAKIIMLDGNIPIIEPAKIKNKSLKIFNDDIENSYASIETYETVSTLSLEANKSLMLLGNDNYEESVLNLYISPDNSSTNENPTTQVTLLKGSPSIYLSEISSQFKFNINTPSNYHDKPFMQCDVPEEADEYLLKILADNDSKIESFGGITLNGNEIDKIVYTSTLKKIAENTCNNIQYFILPNANGNMPDTQIDADKTELYIDDKVTFTIQGDFSADTKFKWYANRKLVQDSTEKSYTHTAQYINDEILCFIYQDENNYKTVDITNICKLNITTDNTPIALYSAVNTSSSYHLYNLTLTDVKNISNESATLNDSLIQDLIYDNCYDSNTTLWWITDSEIYNSNNSETAVVSDLSNLKFIDFDTQANTLYATTMDATHNIYKITETDGKYSQENLFTTEALITCITFHNSYCYTIEEVTNEEDSTKKTYTLKKYAVPEYALPVSINEENYISLLTTTYAESGEIIFSDLIFDDETNSNANTLKNPLFSDIQITDEGIFILFNDCYYNTDSTTFKVDANSRGGIIKINSDFTLASGFGTNGILGWINRNQPFSAENNGLMYAITSYIPDISRNSSQLSEENFYSPRKFLATKPKKLIFTDDGFMFYYNDSDSIYGKDVNQVIEFDIENEIFNSYNIKNQNVKFNKETVYTGSVPGSFAWND